MSTTTDEPAFAVVLRRLRLDAALSQETLAERARVSVESISALERGARRAPYRTTVDLLAAGLGLSTPQRGELLEAAARGRRAQRTGPSRADARAPLPVYVTSFIDRERERGELAGLLEGTRLITLCGPGGVGKTRLPIEVAARVARNRTGGVRFIDLASLRERGDLASAIAGAVPIAAFAPGRGLESILEALRSSELLLLFDNCEHVIDACAQAIEAIVRTCPRVRGVRVLATSREPLLIDGETLYRVSPFLDLQPAVLLFADRAAAASAGQYPAAERAVIESIARRLDGIPLAIELAAALTRKQRPADIARTLATPAFLSGATRRGSVEHQRTMEATLAWSYKLLTDAERSALRVLAYPAAGTAVDAIAAVCGATGAALVTRLIDTSLAIDEGGTGRVKLHQMTRQYVASVTSAAETVTIARRYALWLAAQMSNAFDIGWRSMSYTVYEPLTAELDNVRQALQWALAQANVDVARGLAGAPDYWTAIGRTPEGFRWLTQIDTELEIDSADPRDATLLFGIALCAAQSGLAEQAREPGRRAAETARRHGITRIEARCAIALGNSLLVRGDARAAAASLAAAAALFTSIDDVTGQARALSFRALALVELGAADEAADSVAQVVRLHADMPQPVGATEELVVEMLLGDIARLRGDLAAALDRTREAAALLGGGHRTWIHLRALHQYVDALVAAHNDAAAIATALPELVQLHERGFATDAALLVERLALVLVRRGDIRNAARAAGFSEHTLAAAGRYRMWFDRLVRAKLMAELEAVLSPAELAALQHSGRFSDAEPFIATLSANDPAGNSVVRATSE